MAREYETTHPWLTFSLDLRKVDLFLWLVLGEVQSKVEHIAGVPLRPQRADEFHRVFLAKGVRATTAIEGNTLSEADVLRELDHKLEVPKSKRYLQQEVRNMIDAYGEVFERCFNSSPAPYEIAGTLIKDFNAMVLKDVPVPEEVSPGHLRNYSVGVGTYRGAPWKDCEFLLDRMCSWLNGRDFLPGEHANIAFAVIRAILAHAYLAWIHPFGDGNGRTARLLEFQILVCAGVPSPAAHLLSNHYNETRADYYRHLDYASKSGGDLVPFLRYAIEGFRDGLRSQVYRFNEEHIDVAWHAYVNERLPGDSPTTARRRELVLALGASPNYVRLADMLLLNVAVATRYAGRTGKTLARDLNALAGMGLVLKLGEGRYSANKDVVRSWLPKRVHTLDDSVDDDDEDVSQTR